MRRICFAVLCLAAVCILMPVSATAHVFHPQVLPFLQNAVTGKWHNAKSQGVAAFVCSTDTSTFLRDFSSKSFPVRISTSDWRTALSKLAARTQEKLTYVVDLMCPGVKELLQQAEKERLLKIPNRWLLLNLTEPQDSTANAGTVSTNDPEDGAACRGLARFLVKNDPSYKGTTATDSDVMLVCGEVGRPMTLADMWSATQLGFWGPTTGFHGDRRPPSTRRMAMGLGGREFRVAYMISRNDSLKHMDDGTDPQYDILSKFNWEIINNIVKMINASLAIRITNSYGYNVNGTWTGIIGMQVRGEAEMSGTSIAVVTSRLSVIKYSNFPLPVDGAFIFRAPPMSYEHNLFTQPFPISLWLAMIGSILLCGILLYSTLKLEELVGIEGHASNTPASGIILSEGRKRELGASWSDVALLVFGAVCQQGSPVEARGLTGRIITLFLFIGIVFLYTSYSASIVALLQSTSTNIRSYKDMLHTKMAIGAENQDYNVYYMKHLDDPLRKKIYETKINDNFMSVEEGVRRLRTSYFAFHTMRTLIYKEIADTFKENEKCGLVEIDKFLHLQDPMTSISNWSENTELIMLSLRKQHESGLYNRQIRRFLTPKPQCAIQGGNFQSVSLIDTEAAFMVLGMGYGLSLLFLLIETLFFRYKKALDTLHGRACS